MSQRTWYRHGKPDRSVKFARVAVTIFVTVGVYIPITTRASSDARYFAVILTVPPPGLPPEKWSSLMYGLLPDGGLKNAKEETHG